MKRVLLLAGLGGLALAGCGSSGSSATTDTPAPKASEKSYRGELPPGVTDNPTQALVRQWPARWCQATVGMSRIQLVEIMGALPTKADSGMAPHIPYIKLNSSGENENDPPPRAAGSDTWVVPGPDLLNAFFDSSLHVQQLDFSGPEREIDCASTRVG